MICDECDEEWEPEFFCEKCSRDGRYVTRENHMGIFPETVEEWEPCNICGNCCPGHGPRGEVEP